MAACTKKLPSTPGTPPGQPVMINVRPVDSDLARTITIDGSITNQSGRTIYDVRVGMTVYRDDPIFATVTDTSEIKISSLEPGLTAPFTTFQMKGDVFIEAFPVWTYLPPEEP
jgi:hypothetical protein